MKMPRFLPDVARETDRHCSGCWVMLVSTCCTAEDLGFVRILLQPLRAHPVGDDTDALRQLRRECVDHDGLTRTVHLSVDSVQMW